MARVVAGAKSLEFNGAGELLEEDRDQLLVRQGVW